MRKHEHIEYLLTLFFGTSKRELFYDLIKFWSSSRLQREWTRGVRGVELRAEWEEGSWGTEARAVRGAASGRGCEAAGKVGSGGK